MATNMKAAMSVSDALDQDVCTDTIATAFLHIVNDFLKTNYVQNINPNITILEPREYTPYVKLPRIPVVGLRSFGTVLVDFIDDVVRVLDKYYNNAELLIGKIRAANFRRAGQYVLNFVYTFMNLTVGPYVHSNDIPPEFEIIVDILDVIRDSQESS